MKTNKRQWIGISLYMVIAIILLIWGVIKHETIMITTGMVMIWLNIKNIISLWKLHIGDKDELEKYRAAKDERLLMIWDKAASVAFGVAFIALMVTSFIYLIVLDMFWEGVVVFGICLGVVITYVIAVGYYSKKL